MAHDLLKTDEHCGPRSLTDCSTTNFKHLYLQYLTLMIKKQILAILKMIADYFNVKITNKITINRNILKGVI